VSEALGLGFLPPPINPTCTQTSQTCLISVAFPTPARACLHVKHRTRAVVENSFTAVQHLTKSFFLSKPVEPPLPTPWTAYSFHPIESIVQAGAAVLIIFMVPMHPLALIVFQTVSTAVNVYGHCGYELYPPHWSRHWLGRWINTSVAHNTHHATACHNYGLYFLVWDRWMGTLYPDYDRRYREARCRRDRTGARLWTAYAPKG